MFGCKHNIGKQSKLTYKRRLILGISICYYREASKQKDLIGNKGIDKFDQLLVIV